MIRSLPEPATDVELSTAGARSYQFLYAPVMRFSTAPILLALVVFVSCGDCSAPEGTEFDAGCVDCRPAEDMGRPSDDHGPTFTPCVVDEEGGFCETEFCRVTVEPGTFAIATAVELRQGVPARAIATDVIGDRTCFLGPIDGAAKPFGLTIRYRSDDIPAGFDESELVGAQVSPTFQRTLAAHDIQRDELTFAVEATTEVAVSAIPTMPQLDHVLGVEQDGVSSDWEYIRQLSEYPFEAVTSDGQRLYVATGPRVLIWNDGIPISPSTPPDVVLGRPSLWSEREGASGSNFADTARAVWSDGRRLAVADGNRVLIWNRVPDRDFAPADIVLGQEDFTSNEANAGGTPGPDTIHTADEIWSDGDRFILADAFNNRFLIWNSFPAITRQPADLVVGQDDFTTTRRSAGALPVYRARGVYSNGVATAFASTYACNCMNVVDEPLGINVSSDYMIGESGGGRVSATSHNLPGAISGFGVDGVAFRNGYRVSAWNQFPQAEEHEADLTIGRPDTVLGAPFGRTTAATLVSSSPAGHVFANNTFMAVADGYRLLLWRGLPTHDFQQADLVLGQPSFTSAAKAVDYRGIGRETLAQPAAVATHGDLTAIADRANNRVLILRGSPIAPTQVTVLGQPTPAEAFPNAGKMVPSAASLSGPAGVYVDDNRLIVADAGNHRVLVWNQVPTQDFAPADLVLGQTTFDVGRQNTGLGDADADGDADAHAASLHFPSDVAFDGRIYVADTFNHRVLVWDAIPTRDGEPASRVIGQVDMVSNDPNRGLGWYARDANSLARPTAVEPLDAERIVISDSENNRVLVFPNDAADPVAEIVLGQPDFITDQIPSWLTGFNVGWPTGENTLTPTSTSLRRPIGLAVDDQRLWVADTGNHRLVEYSRPLTASAAGLTVYGQPDATTRIPNAGGLAETSVHAPEGAALTSSGSLLVADTMNHRLVGTGTGIFGQSTAQRNGINGSAPSVGRLDGPGGLAATKESLWVADRDHHRLIEYRDGGVQRVVGQINDGDALPNGGLGGPGDWTLSRPADVWTDGVRLVVADRNNHRVLVWNTVPTAPRQPANVVIGQADMFSGEPNGGNGATSAGPNTLHAPEGVWVDGGSLFIADTGNSRVLVFEQIPTTDGASADRTLCQLSPNTNLPNRGQGAPDASSCSGPTDVVVADGKLLVADTLNNRVLVFDVGADAGSPANLVLGQPDFATRLPTDERGQPTAAIFASPVRLATDGTNLYVVDRGNHRVLIFDAMPTESSVPADRLLGQVSFEVSAVTTAEDGLDSPGGIAVLPQPYRSSTVWIADTGKDRIVEFTRVARPF